MHCYACFIRCWRSICKSAYFRYIMNIVGRKQVRQLLGAFVNTFRLIFHSSRSLAYNKMLHCVAYE